MDESFILAERLSKETGYKYNITNDCIYDKQSICYIFEYLSSF